MRPLIASTLMFAALATATLVPDLCRAQGRSQDGVPMPPSGFKPPPPAPIKPYKPIAVTPPAPYSDQSFIAFRQQLAGIVQRKDRASLAKLIVAQGFFWMQEQDMADKRKPGIDNLAAAIGLDAKNGYGWDILAGYAEEPTAAPVPERQGLICAPAMPNFDYKAFEALTQATQTDPAEWGYPLRNGLEVRNAPQPNAPVIEKLGMYLVRVLSDSAPPTNPNQPAFLHVATPSGKSGYAPADGLAGLGGDQMCYFRDASGWKIAGYFGGAPQEAQ